MIYLQKFNEVYDGYDDITSLSDAKMVNKFIETETFDLIQDKLRFLNYNLTNYTISSISLVISTKYDLFCFDNHLSYDNDSPAIATVNKQTPKERKEFYKNGDWYIFRIFVSDENNNCVVIGIHRAFIRKFLEPKSNNTLKTIKEPIREPIKEPKSSGREWKKSNDVPIGVNTRSLPPVKKPDPVSMDKLKELLAKIRQKKLQ